MPRIETYRSPEEAARASRERLAVSPPYHQKTPRGMLPCVLIKPLYGQAWWAYASAHGIRVPETYAPVLSSDIDRVKDWMAY